MTALKPRDLGKKPSLKTTSSRAMLSALTGKTDTFLYSVGTYLLLVSEGRTTAKQATGNPLRPTRISFAALLISWYGTQNVPKRLPQGGHTTYDRTNEISEASTMPSATLGRVAIPPSGKVS